MTNKKTRICFVCTDNIGRSLIAEYCLKDYSRRNNFNSVISCSAGTNANSNTDGFCFAHFEELGRKGMNVSKHKRTQLTQKIIDEMDLIVAMAVCHQKWIKENFNIDVPMFSEIMGIGKRSYIIPKPNTKECPIVLRNMVHEIYKNMPKFIENSNKFIINEKAHELNNVGKQ